MHDIYKKGGQAKAWPAWLLATAMDHYRQVLLYNVWKPVV